MLNTAYIQKTRDSAYNISKIASYGFSALGYNIEWFDTLPTIPEDALVVGHIEVVRDALFQRVGKRPEIINYPVALQDFYGRKIEQAKLSEVRDNPDTWPIFIKPAEELKTFTGRLIQDIQDLRVTAGIPGLALVFTSEPIVFKSEYRVFVQRGEVVGCRFYKGDSLAFPDSWTIRDMVTLWDSSPAAYCLDVGVAKHGQTFLVEVNDAHSAGPYGLDPVVYARWIETRWCELTNTKPIV